MSSKHSNSGSSGSSGKKGRRASGGPASLPKRSSVTSTSSAATTANKTARTSGNSSNSSNSSTRHRRQSTATRDSIQTNASSGLLSRGSDPAGLTAASSPIKVPFPAETGLGADRDSISSIVDDPFFQRLHSANDFDTGREVSGDSVVTGSQDDSDDNIKTQRWPPPRRESLTIGSSQNWPHPISTMESYNVAIIGADAVGKSTFVQRALNLARPPIANSSSARVVVDQVPHVVTLLELDLEHFELNPSQPIQWPKQINGHIVPRVDAALVLYDVMSRESIRELPQMVAALTNSGLPAVLVACKCDNPEDDWEVNADELAKHRFFKPCIGQYKISIDKADVPRACLHGVVRAAIMHRRDENGGEAVSRRRAQSAANLEAPEPTGGRPLSEHSKHNRASSDFSVPRAFSNQQQGDTYRKRASRSPRPGFRIDKTSGDSFLDIDESDSDSRRYSDDIPILQRGDDAIVEKPKVTGVTFEELVDRLLAPRLSRVDNNFSDMFLCLYRKFAAPGKLFSAILVRLEKVRGDESAHYLTKTATQLRIIEVVAKWVSLYPGDFARPTTRRNLEDFIKHLSTEPIFAIAAQQMRRNLHLNVIEDDDTGWANSDNSVDEIASKILSKEMSELSVSISTLQFDGEFDGATGGSDKSSMDRGSRIGSQFPFNSFEEYGREAMLLEPSDHLPMNKFRYHIFMDISDHEIADELTRIDWIMFSSIRVRDFVRHVSLSAAQKDKCKSLQNVNRMINHFNHIAKWVANMILLRDKAKHRAQMLEKFMNIALKLRQLNNYNGLAAVLAGLNGTAIHRLAQTRALVPAEVQKRFARLVILMGTQKSHFAYRLAWENSPLPRIPFIPLHRRDLVSAEEGSKTFVGPNDDRINWKKFEVLGEVLLPIMKSQGTAYPNLFRHDTAGDLILGCCMPMDDEEIYQRSLQVESSASGPIEPSKKKFPWFANK